jgi:iron complex transport system ATP-binding protein
MIGDLPAIALAGVGVVRDRRWILRDIHWTVPAGSCAAILGPNGSGKSTLTRVIAGHLGPTAGDVRVLGEHFGEVDLHELRRGIRLVQSNSPVEMDGDLTAFDIVLTGYFGTLGLYDPVTREMRDEAERMLDLVGLHAVGHHRYNTLSTGERMRTLIARAMVQRPRLLMLDEPTNGLDLLAREQVLAAVGAMLTSGPDRPTILIITHHLEELPPATDQVLLLSEGTAAAKGSMAEVLREEVLAPVYGCPMKISCTEGRYYAIVSPGAWNGLLGKARG